MHTQAYYPVDSLPGHDYQQIAEFVRVNEPAIQTVKPTAQTAMQFKGKGCSGSKDLTGNFHDIKKQKWSPLTSVFRCFTFNRMTLFEQNKNSEIVQLKTEYESPKIQGKKPVTK